MSTARVMSTLAMALIAWTPSAQADRVHEVRPGQTLSAIAQRYHVSVDALAAANHRGREDMLRPGDVLRVPERGVVYVGDGDTLSGIARRHGVSIEQLARVNRIGREDTLRVGQRLVLPGHEAAQERDRAARRWGKPRHPGVATLMTYTPKRRVRVRLVDRRGRPRAAARRQMAALMRHAGSGRTRLPPRRLVQVLARISDHFGGRPIAIVSGYRPPGGHTRRTSRHTRGYALDIRIAGVPNRALRDYCRKLGGVGVGFYPRSTFVHVDVRRESGYWVDWSAPGQAPRYRRPGAMAKSESESEADAEAESDLDAATEAESESEAEPGVEPEADTTGTQSDA